MSKNRKVIITCAVTGSIHTPSMSPYLPITADNGFTAEILAQAAQRGRRRGSGRSRRSPG